MSDVKQQARDRSRELFRQGITDAAQRVFEAKGFAGTRMADIATEAGLATGTLYNYFPSKESILVELMEATGSAFLEALTLSLEVHDSPLDKLVAFVHAGLAFANEHRSMYRLFHEAVPSGNEVPDLVEQKRAVEERYEQLLLSIVREAQQVGEIRAELDPGLVTLIVGASLHGLLDVVVGDPNAEIDASTAFEALEDILLKGIKT